MPGSTLGLLLVYRARFNPWLTILLSPLLSLNLLTIAYHIFIPTLRPKKYMLIFVLIECLRRLALINKA